MISLHWGLSLHRWGFLFGATNKEITTNRRMLEVKRVLDSVEDLLLDETAFVFNDIALYQKLQNQETSCFATKQSIHQAGLTQREYSLADIPSFERVTVHLFYLRKLIALCEFSLVALNLTQFLGKKRLGKNFWTAKFAKEFSNKTCSMAMYLLSKVFRNRTVIVYKFSNLGLCKFMHEKACFQESNRNRAHFQWLAFVLECAIFYKWTQPKAHGCIFLCCMHLTGFSFGGDVWVSDCVYWYGAIDQLRVQWS